MDEWRHGLCLALRRKRAELGLSNQEIGNRAQISPTIVSHALRGGSASIDRLAEIADALGLRLVIDVVEKAEQQEEQSQPFPGY